MADSSTLTFPQISLGSRGGVSQGQLRLSPAGLNWRRSGGGKVIDIKREDISGLYWMRLSKDAGFQLGVRQAEGATINFMGFRDKDLEGLTSFCKSSYQLGVTSQELATAGRNWGRLALNGSSLMFLVDDKVMMEVPLPDVNQAQQQKDEVMLEFHVDDTAGDREDVLVDMSFHVPATNPDWKPPPEGPQDENAARGLLGALLPFTDAGGAASEDAIAEFEEVAVLAPRGRFLMELHSSYFKMTGQTNDFKVRYPSIVRIWILPKSATPHTLVVVSLDPPIRKGNTYYSHLLCQFGSSDEPQAPVELSISDELLASKNEKCGGKLARSMDGLLYEVFARTLAGLSGAKISRASTNIYTNASSSGCDIRCSYKTDDGFLYPLKHSFVYVHKPPLLIQHQDIEYVDFQRQGGSVVSSSVRTFDLAIKVKNNAQEFLFRNINRAEWHNLFEFIQAKNIRIKDFKAAQQGPMGFGGAAAAIDLDDGELDAGMRAAAAEADSEDEDFDAGADSGSESESISGSGASDSESGSSDAELVDEEGINVADIVDKPAKKRKAEESGGGGGGGEAAPKNKPKKAKAAAAAAGGEGEEGGGGPPAKKPRKKKDPNAPKKALSAFMYFSNSNRDRIKTENPGVAFGQVGKLLGEAWKALPDADKVQYQEMADKDKQRYAEAMAAYRAGGGGGAAAAEEDGGDGEDVEEVGE